MDIYQHGLENENSKKISYPFPDENIVHLLIDYTFKEIVPLDPLLVLVENKYVSPDERKFQKQYKQAWIAIIIAIVIGILSIYLNYSEMK